MSSRTNYYQKVDDYHDYDHNYFHNYYRDYNDSHDDNTNYKHILLNNANDNITANNDNGINDVQYATNLWQKIKPVFFPKTSINSFQTASIIHF